MSSKQTGARIAALLRNQGMTQRALAERVGATESAISKYVSGAREPRAEVLANIATALDTTVEYLLGKGEGVETEFGTVYDLCARHAPHLTMEERNKLIAVLVSAPAKEGD